MKESGDAREARGNEGPIGRLSLIEILIATAILGIIVSLISMAGGPNWLSVILIGGSVAAVSSFTAAASEDVARTTTRARQQRIGRALRRHEGPFFQRAEHHFSTRLKRHEGDTA